MKKSIILFVMIWTVAGGCAFRHTVRQTKGAVSIRYPKSATADKAYVEVKKNVQRLVTSTGISIKDLTDGVDSSQSLTFSPIVSAGEKVRYPKVWRDSYLISELFRGSSAPWGKTGIHQFEVRVIDADGRPVEFYDIAINLKPALLVCKSVSKPPLKVCYPARAVPSEAFLQIQSSWPIAAWRIKDKQSGWEHVRDRGLTSVGNPPFSPADLKKIEKFSQQPFRLVFTDLFPVPFDSFNSRDRIDISVQIEYENGAQVVIDGISIRFR